MKIFVISMIGADKRQEQITAQLNRLELEFEFFQAVNGRLLTNEERMQHCDEKWQRRYTGRVFSPGENGCALSHINVYRKIVNENIDKALIFEDDAWITPSLKDILASINEQKISFDILLLSECQTGKMVCRFNYSSVRPFHFGYFTHAYCISKEAAQKMINTLYPIAHVADCWRWLKIHNIVQIYAITPVLVTQNQAVLGSSTSENRMVLPPTLSMAWLIYKAYRAFWIFFDKIVPVRYHKYF